MRAGIVRVQHLCRVVSLRKPVELNDTCRCCIGKGVCCNLRMMVLCKVCRQVQVNLCRRLQDALDNREQLALQLSRKADETAVRKLARDVIELQRAADERREHQANVEGKVASLQMQINGAVGSAAAPEVADNSASPSNCALSEPERMTFCIAFESVSSIVRASSCDRRC